MIVIWMKIHLVSENNSSTVQIPSDPQKKYQEWQIIVSLQIVLVILDIRCTISIQQDKQYW